MKRFIKANTLYLYHATNKKNLDSIMEKGLLMNSSANWEEMYIEDQVFLALNTKAAKEYFKGPKEDLIMLKVSLDSLDSNYINSISN